MIFNLYPYDSEHFATQLHLVDAEQRLDWAIKPGQSVLLIRTPFNQKADDILEKLCDELSKLDTMPNQYSELFSDTWVRTVSSSEKSKMGGCPLLDRPATYTVIAYEQKEQEICLYLPQSNSMNKHFCHVSFSVSLVVQRVMQESKRFLRSPEMIETPYYMISFPNDIAEVYHDGDLFYQVDHISIPITQKMIQNGVIYIRTEGRVPTVRSKNPGINLTIN